MGLFQDHSGIFGKTVVVWYYFGMNDETAKRNGAIFSVLSLIFGILTLPTSIFGVIFLVIYLGFNNSGVAIGIPLLLIVGAPVLTAVFGSFGLKLANVSWQKSMAMISMGISGFVFLLSCFIAFVLFLT